MQLHKNIKRKKHNWPNQLCLICYYILLSQTYNTLWGYGHNSVSWAIWTKKKFPFSCLKFFFLGCKAYFSIHLGHIIYKNLIYLSHVTFRSTVTCHILRKLSIFGLTRGVKNFKMRHFFGQFEKNGRMLPSEIAFMRATCGRFFEFVKISAPSWNFKRHLIFVTCAIFTK